MIKIDLVQNDSKNKHICQMVYMSDDSMKCFFVLNFKKSQTNYNWIIFLNRDIVVAFSLKEIKAIILCEGNQAE